MYSRLRADCLSTVNTYLSHRQPAGFHVPQHELNRRAVFTCFRFRMVDEAPQTRSSVCKGSWNVTGARACTFVLLGSIAWLVALFLFGSRCVGLHSPFLKLAVLFVGSKSVGLLLRVTPLPSMLGMLSVGVLARNIGYVDPVESESAGTCSVLRQLALVNILLVAGLGLEAEALKRMSRVVLGLAILAPACEILAAAALSSWLLDLPWNWALSAGFLLGAVSPALVIPCLLDLRSKGYGVDKGIDTLVIASSAIDDIACIAGFGVTMGVIFEKGSSSGLIEAPVSVVGGVVYGLASGMLGSFLPGPKDDYLVSLRTLFVVASSLLAIFGSQAIGFEGAGSLACIVSSFVSSSEWKKKGWVDEVIRQPRFETLKNSTSALQNPVKKNFSILWEIFEPISFSLIGVEVDLKILDGGVVLWTGLVILLSLFVSFARKASGKLDRVFCFQVRISTSFLITKYSELNLKEMAFVGVCSVPKATVQAALGPVALDYARNSNVDAIRQYADVLLITAVVSIIVTAPIGAALIVYTGPKLLKKSDVTLEPAIVALNNSES